MRLMGLFGRTSRVLFLLILLFALWQVWVFVRPRPTPLTQGQIAAVELAARQLADSIRAGLGAEGEVPLRIGVAHFLNDPSDQVTDTVRATLASVGQWKIEESSVVQRFLADVSRAVAQATTLDELLHAGRRVQLDAVVAGNVVALEDRNGAAEIAIALYAYDARGGRWLLNETIRKSWRPGVVQQSTAALKRMRPVTRLLIWLAFAGALPWATGIATRWTLEHRSNLASFVLLTAYTALDLAAAMALMGFRVIGAGGGVKLIGAFLLCAVYNFWACERIARVR